jgi:hypothetical protein
LSHSIDVSPCVALRAFFVMDVPRRERNLRMP